MSLSNFSLHHISHAFRPWLGTHCTGRTLAALALSSSTATTFASREQPSDYQLNMKGVANRLVEVVEQRGRSKERLATHTPWSKVTEIVFHHLSRRCSTKLLHSLTPFLVARLARNTKRPPHSLDSLCPPKKYLRNTPRTKLKLLLGAACFFAADFFLFPTLIPYFFLRPSPTALFPQNSLVP